MRSANMPEKPSGNLPYLANRSKKVTTENPISQSYVERVNRAIDHIVLHRAEPLRLEDVSEAAGFSPFHFHRIFKAIVGETLNQFVKRQRLERALYRMSHAPQRSLTDV